MKNKILVINPGSTSTKIAVYNDEIEIFEQSITHKQEELDNYDEIYDQYEMRKQLILLTLKNKNIQLDSLDAIAARGGLLPPAEAGAYEVNDDMVYQLRYHPQNEHASNLGAIIADSISKQLGIKSYIYDPVTVDELEPIAKITGLPEMERKGMGHNLNMRAAAIKYSQSIKKEYSNMNLIVAHLGGGITLSLHNNGRMIDMISDDEGPFSPERAGGLPIFQVIEMSTSSECDFKGMMRKVRNRGGLKAYFDTTDSREVEALVKTGDKYAGLIYEAMAHNTAKNIGKLAVVLSGKVDAIILTGGIAYSDMFTKWIENRVDFIAPVVKIPGENEMEALAFGILRVLKGEEKVKQFTL